MKPIIGICADYSYGISELYGGFGNNFNWQLVTDDYIKAVENAGGYDIEPKHYNENIGFKLGTISPERDDQELYLAKSIIYKSQMPSLGICRGCQLLNVAGGGSLYQDLSDIECKENQKNINHFAGMSPKYNPVHKANIKLDSKFYTIFNKETIEINSYHHQVIKDVADNFQISAIAEDGVVETIEIKEDRFVLGVQWHPEMMEEKSEEQRLIFKAFINAAMEFKKRK